MVPSLHGPHYEENTDGIPLKIFSLSVNYTAIEEQKLSNIKVVLKPGINELGQSIEQLTICPRVIAWPYHHVDSLFRIQIVVKVLSLCCLQNQVNVSKLNQVKPNLEVK